MAGKDGKKKRRILFAGEMVLLLLALGILYVYGQITSRIEKMEPARTESAPAQYKYKETEIVTNNTAPVMTGYRTLVVFGLDHRSKNAALGGQNSDTMIIVSINNDTKDVKMVSVYRDTLLNIGDDTYSKANAAYAYGGPVQAVSMLNTNLDLNITDYVSVDFNAVTNLVDAVGGIEVPLSYAEIVHLNNYCVETSEETGKSYTPIPLPDQVPEDQEEILDLYHVNGVQATSYCRIRYTSNLDMGRTERQRRVIQLVVNKLKKSSIPTLLHVMDEVLPMVQTSLTATEILQMAPAMIGYSLNDTTGFPAAYKFSNVKGSIIVADTLAENVKELHSFLYGEDDVYTPSSNIQEISDKIIEIVGGKATLQEAAPQVTEAPGTSNDFVWTRQETSQEGTVGADTQAAPQTGPDQSSSQAGQENAYSRGGQENAYSQDGSGQTPAQTALQTAPDSSGTDLSQDSSQAASQGEEAQGQAPSQGEDRESSRGGEPDQAPAYEEPAYEEPAYEEPAYVQEPQGEIDQAGSLAEDTGDWEDFSSEAA